MFAVSIKGGAHRWFREAVDRGDLVAARAEIGDLPGVNLADALDLALLICEHEPENAERAAVRWIGRYCLERRAATFGQVREAVDAFALLIYEPDAGEATLRRLVERSG